MGDVSTGWSGGTLTRILHTLRQLHDCNVVRNRRWIVEFVVEAASRCDTQRTGLLDVQTVGPQHHTVSVPPAEQQRTSSVADYWLRTARWHTSSVSFIRRIFYMLPHLTRFCSYLTQFFAAWFSCIILSSIYVKTGHNFCSLFPSLVTRLLVCHRQMTTASRFLPSKHKSAPFKTNPNPSSGPIFQS
jgi:hypothetical protein